MASRPTRTFLNPTSAGGPKVDSSEPSTLIQKQDHMASKYDSLDQPCFDPGYDAIALGIGHHSDGMYAHEPSTQTYQPAKQDILHDTDGFDKHQDFPNGDPQNSRTRECTLAAPAALRSSSREGRSPAQLQGMDARGRASFPSLIPPAAYLTLLQTFNEDAQAWDRMHASQETQTGHTPSPRFGRALQVSTAYSTTQSSEEIISLKLAKMRRMQAEALLGTSEKCNQTATRILSSVCTKDTGVVPTSEHALHEEHVLQSTIGPLPSPWSKHGEDQDLVADSGPCMETHLSHSQLERLANPTTATRGANRVSSLGSRDLSTTNRIKTADLVRKLRDCQMTNLGRGSHKGGILSAPIRFNFEGTRSSAHTLSGASSTSSNLMNLEGLVSSPFPDHLSNRTVSAESWQTNDTNLRALSSNVEIVAWDPCEITGRYRQAKGWSQSLGSEESDKENRPADEPRLGAEDERALEDTKEAALKEL